MEESGFEPSAPPRMGAELPSDGVRLGAVQRCSEKRIRRKWDQRFESAFLQRRVRCELRSPRSRRSAPGTSRAGFWPLAITLAAGCRLQRRLGSYYTRRQSPKRMTGKNRIPSRQTLTATSVCVFRGLGRLNQTAPVGADRWRRAANGAGQQSANRLMVTGERR